MTDLAQRGHSEWALGKRRLTRAGDRVNRGLGQHLAAKLRDRGVHVYATARDPHAVDLAGVTPIALDITDPASVAAATRRT